MQDIFTLIESRRQSSLVALKEFLSIPSVSTKPEHKPDMQRCAAWLVDQLTQGGLGARMIATAGHPIVLAKTAPRPGAPTVLFYGHYDVQPPEPLDQWMTPPFEPAVRPTTDGNDAIYARGAADDKGQVWALIEAVLAWQTRGGPPVNCTLLIEGEEEIGSDHLAEFIRAHRAELKADIALIHDSGQFARDIPAITYGLRGLIYEEIVLRGPSHDLHSGIYGGAVPNPGNVLSDLISSLHDEHGRVTVEGFYDQVRPLSEVERQMWQQLPFSDREFARGLGLVVLSGEAGYSTLERRWGRPTLDVNGITCGYQGHGAKTIIPSTASAKISMRLVPDQDPARIQAAFEKTLSDRCPTNVKIEFQNHGLAAPVLVPMDSKATRLASEAVKIGFGIEPTFVREGGSIPVVGLIKRELGIDTLLVGYGLPDDRVHSPNEKFDLDALYKGSRTSAALLEQLAML